MGKPLQQDWLQSECESFGLPWRVEVHEALPSTNSYLRDRMEVTLERAVFAEEQTAGRGRRANRWHAEPGENLLFSVSCQPKAEMALWPRMTALAALAVCRAIESELPLQPTIKWPNDIFIGDRKVAGLLLEVTHHVTEAVVVLGLGINVNALSFPAELEDRATSLRIESPGVIRERGVDRHPLALALLRELSWVPERLKDGFTEAIAEVRQRSWLMGKQVRLLSDGNEFWGRVVDLDAEGRLVLLDGHGKRLRLASAEQVRAVG